KKYREIPQEMERGILRMKERAVLKKKDREIPQEMERGILRMKDRAVLHAGEPDFLKMFA
ncbi:MAG: hypothetical protein IKS16_03995, partial [Lachnospiraceae bacterium]|nr:hypothetical protein [Lachnospiraceae bacterium]